MGQCPHCGSDITDDSKCPNCGQSLDTLPEYQSVLSGQASAAPPQPAAEANDQQESVSSADDAESETDGRLSGKLSRRALLGGIGGSVAVLGVGGASWIYLQGGGAGNGVIRSYVNAMKSENWAEAEKLFHEESQLRTRIEESSEFDGYESYLEAQEALEPWKKTKPNIEGIEEFYHATEVTEESVSELQLQLEGETVEMVDEVRSAVAFLSVEVGKVNEERTDAYYKDGSENRTLTCTLVLVDGEWSLWDTFGFRRYA